MRALRFFLTALFLAAGAGAQDLSNFDRILIPLVVNPPIEGANGDVFSAGVIALFPTSSVRVFPIYPVPAGGPEIGKPVEAIFGSGLQRPLFTSSTPSRSGRMLLIERSASQQTILHAKVDTTNPAIPGSVASAVTQPVVRERDFKTDRTSLIGMSSPYVLSDNGGLCRAAAPVYRHTLRIYDVDGGQNAQVIVRRFDPAFGPPLMISEEVVTIAYRDGTDPSYPSYAEMSLPEVCHPFSCHTPCAGGSQFVEITPVTPGLRFWAMVSATNNFTHQVTLFYPQ